VFYMVDSDNYPVWLLPVSKEQADAMIASGEAYASMSAEHYSLLWASRFGAPARWLVVPR
jgi:hypothetical protein